MKRRRKKPSTNSGARKRLGERLEKIEERFREAMDATNDGLWDSNVETGETYCSPAYYRMLGYETDDFHAHVRSWKDLIHPDDRDRVVQANKDCIENRATKFEVEFRMKARDGTWKWILSRGKASLRDGDGRALRVIGTHVDVTERRQSEESLRRRAAELAALQSTTLDITQQQDMPKLLNAIVERAAHLLSAPSGGLYICDPECRELRCVVSYNTRKDYAGTVLKYGEGAAGRVAETGKPLSVDDYRVWPGRATVFEKDQPFIALLSTPMIWQGKVTGVIHVLDTRPRHFTRSDLELLGMLANHAAIVLENQRGLIALRENEERFRKIFEEGPFGMALVRPDYGFARVNRVICSMLGYSENELTKLRFTDITHPEDIKLGVELTEKMLRGEIPSFSIEKRYVKKNGEVLPARLTASLILDRKGAPAYSVAIIEDITERKRMEQELSRSSQFLGSVIENAYVWLNVLDNQQNILVWNKAAETMSGYSREEVVGHSKIWKWLYPDQGYRKQTIENVIRTLQSGRTDVDTETTIKRKDGHTRIISWNERALTDRDGRAIGTIAIGHDVTERKETEEKLRQSEERYRSLFQGMMEGFAYCKMIFDGGGRPVDFVYIDVNSAFGPLTGLEDVVGKKVSEVIPGIKKTNPELFEIYGRVASTGKPERFEVDVKPLGISLNISVSSPATGYFFAVFENITERKKDEERLRQSEERHRSLFDQMLDGVYRSTHEGRFVDVNPAFVKIFGYSSKQEMLNIKDIKKELYFQPEERGSHVLDTGQEEVEVYRMRRKDGSEIWVEDHGHYVHDEQGNVLYHEGILRDVTERKRTEEQVHNASLYARSLIEASLDPLVTIRSDGKVTDVNRATELVTEVSRDRLIGSDFSAYFTEPEKAREGYEEAFSKGFVKDFPLVIRGKSGKVTEVLYNATVYRNEDGKIQGVFAAARDITERKKAEEALLKSEERHRSLFDRMLDGVYRSTHEGRFVDVNPAFVEMFGYSSKQEMLDIADIKKELYFSPEERASHFLDTGKEKVEVFRMRRKDGSEIWVEDHGRYVHDEQGNVIYHEGILRDFTERKRLEEELKQYSSQLEKLVDERTRKLLESQEDLRAARERLEYVVTSNPAAIYTGRPFVDYSDWRLTYLSDRVTTMLGFEPEKFIGHPEFWESHVHQDDLRDILAVVPRVFKEGKGTFEYRFLHKDGTYRWIREESKVISDENGKPIEVNGYWTDVTELKKIEERLAESERLAAIGQTAAMVGHDLRNPLQGIAGALHLLRDDSLSEQERTEMLRVIEKSLEYSDAIVRDLTDFSMEIQLKRADTTPRSITRDALGVVKVPRNVTIQDSTEDQPTLRIDPTSMRRVFVNLVENAIDSMPQGGILKLSSKKSDSKVEIVLADSGSGVPEKVMENLWKPLQTTKAKGLGLGLAICKRVVDAHGGDITVKSKIGEGTSIAIRLPIKPDGREVRET